MQLILLGPPGSGKGVQGDLIVNRYKIPHVSTGNILRKSVEEKTKLGQEALSYMEKGLLVPDSIIIKILESELDSPRCKSGFVLDGVPRTIPQAESLENGLKIRKRPIDRVIYLSVEEETLVKRLTNRRTCEKCGRVYNILDHPPQKNGKCDACGGNLIQRVDDREDTVRKRFQVYDSQTKPLLEFYEKRKKLVKFDGDRMMATVFADICAELDKIKVS